MPFLELSHVSKDFGQQAVLHEISRSGFSLDRLMSLLERKFKTI